jgi:hypothetical protein
MYSLYDNDLGSVAFSPQPGDESVEIILIEVNTGLIFCDAIFIKLTVKGT